MAREEHDREDILAEARALTERASVALSGVDEPVVFGFRRDRGASFYFGADRVYHITSDGQLRRAFVDDLLYKAENGRLVALRRERSAQEVALVRHELSTAEQAAFVAEMHARFERLAVALAAGDFRLLGQVPESIDVVDRTQRWLDEFGKRITISPAPNVG
ncbi:MAG: hypothetical protein AB7O59_23960 [Pirellulales bacterium]